MNQIGKTLVFIGIFIAIAGLMLSFSSKIPYIGRLPGDIKIEKENFTFYFPLTTSLILSAVLSLIFWLFQRK